jgi:hypothetical protein
MSDINVLSPETGAVAYKLDSNIRVCRYEPKDITSPMAPHPSPYAPYGRWEFGHDHLFMAEERILRELTALRRKQGYFESGVVLRSAILGELMAKYPRGTLLEDIKFNITVIGKRYAGALILAVPH